MAIVIRKKAGAGTDPAPVVEFDRYAPEVEEERRRRIRIALAALAYEVDDDPIMTDAEFDQLAREINPLLKTGNEAVDAFFLNEFSSSTGSWIHAHPELEKLKAVLKRIRKPAASS